MEATELESFFSASWAGTVKRFNASLDTDDRETVENFKTWESVMEWLVGSAPPSIMLIRPALGHLHIFSRFFGAENTPLLDLSYLWGSLVCLLRLVSRNMKVLEHVPRMIKSLAFRAETFNGYCARSSVVENTIKEVCFDMQLQFAEFFTTSIKHIRAADSDERYEKGPGCQQRIQRAYEMTTLELGEALTRLEKLEAIQRSREVGSPKATAVGESTPKPHFIMTPPAKISRLFDRLDVFVKLDELLTPDAGDFSLQSVALHGLAGVGKSSIASSYAEKKFVDQAYDVVLWVCGEKEASLRQSFTDIAMRLKLPGAQVQSHDENQVLVQDWFRVAECKWLIIYDNVESADILIPYWPRPSHFGRALITTRNRSLAFEPAASGIEVTSWDAETGSDFLLFLLKKSVGRDINSEILSARMLSERLSGHALALSQMAGLIYDGEYTVKDFTAMYLENPRSAHGMNELSALWDFTFRSLDKNSFTLLGIVSFLMPDSMPPDIFEPSNNCDLPTSLDFLKEKFTGFSVALRKLTARALIKRDKDSGILTVHRLIQTQFRYFLNAEKRQEFFNNTVTLLSFLLPNNEIEKGQLYDTWEGYNRYLQHVLNLRDIFEEERKSSLSFKAPQKFCEILIEYQRFLYENCAFEECQKTCTINFDAVSTLNSAEDRVDLEASIISHQCQVLEKSGDFQEAINLCRRGIDIRLGESPRKQILLAFSMSNLGIMYNSANNFTKALEYFQESRQWWTAHFESKGETRETAASMLVSEARCLIDLGQLETAKEMLDSIVVSLKKDKPLNFGTMAYTYYCIGTLERLKRRFESAEAAFMESENVWLGGGQTRLHPFNAGILYKIGACCLDQGKVEASIKHINDSLEVTEFYSRIMPTEHGRNLFKLSEALLQNGADRTTEAAEKRKEAELYLSKRTNDVEPLTEQAYDRLLPVYWR